MQLLYDYYEEIWFWRRFFPGVGHEKSESYPTLEEAKKAYEKNEMHWEPD